MFTEVSSDVLAAFFLVMLSFLLFAVIYFDIRAFIIPDEACLAIFCVGITWGCLVAGQSVWTVVASAGIGGAFMLGVQRAFRAYRAYDGLGTGDVKLVAALATWTEVSSLPMALALSSMSALIFILLQRQLYAHKTEERVPFGPFLAFGFFCLIVQSQILPVWAW